jgi:hypothetical protein
MFFVARNCMIEWSYTSTRQYDDPFNEVELFVEMTDPDGVQISVPAFWAGRQTWSIRYTPSKLGRYHFRTVCSDETNRSLHGKEGDIEVTVYEGSNPLYRHGPVRVASNRKYLEHSDGTPFFWLADTWWMGLTKRLSWPEEFKLLAADRVEKGFSVIQIVAGLYPDMEPFDERGANEAGFPWDREFRSINPYYFDMADLRVDWLVRSSLVPCIVGCWGYFMDFAGKDVIKKHWRYLVARYGAYPVVWCIAGEALMPFYGSFKWTREQNARYEALWFDRSSREDYTNTVRSDWTDVTRYVKRIDPYKHCVTIVHGRSMVDDPSILDLELMGGPHSSDRNALAASVNSLSASTKSDVQMPVINGEVAYEGICGTCGQEVQRYVFWANMFNGAAGHTYGADGVWQLNRKDRPFGPSPHGSQWGDTLWTEAYQLPGSRQLGIAKGFLKRYPWWQLEQHPEWLEFHKSETNPIVPYALGIPGKIRIVYVPYSLGSPLPVIVKLERDVKYRAFYFDPITGKEYVLGEVTGNEEGKWSPENYIKCTPPLPLLRDVVMVLERSDG